MTMKVYAAMLTLLDVAATRWRQKCYEAGVVMRPPRWYFERGCPYYFYWHGTNNSEDGLKFVYGLKFVPGLKAANVEVKEYWLCVSKASIQQLLWPPEVQVRPRRALWRLRRVQAVTAWFNRRCAGVNRAVQQLGIDQRKWAEMLNAEEAMVCLTEYK